MKKQYWIGRARADGRMPFMLARTGPATEGERTALRLPLPSRPLPRDEPNRLTGDGR